MTRTYEATDSARGSQARCWPECPPPKSNSDGTADQTEHALVEILGVTRLMSSVFAEHGITTIEDLAGCATDDLTGWREFRLTGSIQHRGILDGFGVSRRDCEAMILNARIKAGWITSYP